MVPLAHRQLPIEAEMPAVFQEWLQWLPLLEDKPANTVRAYSQGVRRIVSYAGSSPSDFSPGMLDQASLTDTVRSMRSSGEISKATLNQSLAALKSFYDYCLADRLVETVPDISRIRRVAKLDVPQRKPEYYRPAEIRDLYGAAISEDNEHGRHIRWAARDLAMCSFLAVLGLRASELTGADLEWVTRESLVDVDDRPTFMLQVKGKGLHIRRLPLSPELAEANSRWQDERKERFGPSRPDEPLFVANDGARFNYGRLYYWFSDDHTGLRKRAGMGNKLSLHSLRHTAGVQLAADGAPMNVIQSLLGHASIATTGIYTALAGGELVGVVQRTAANTLLGAALDGGTS